MSAPDAQKTTIETRFLRLLDRSAFLFAACLLLGVADLPCQASESAKGKKPEVQASQDPHGMRLWQLVLLRRGPQYDKVVGARRQKLFAGHMANIDALAKKGKLRLAGPFVVGAGTDAPKDASKHAYAGLFLLDVKTREEAEALCRTDPAIASGVFTVEILGWYGPSDITYRGDKAPKTPRKK